MQREVDTMPEYSLTLRCPSCHGVAELVGMTGSALVYACACGERAEEGRGGEVAARLKPEPAREAHG